MAEQPKESRLASRLRELGFRPVEEIDHPDVMTAEEREENAREEAEFIKRLPRKKRRAIESMRAGPRFLYSDGWTFAHDETGKEWALQKKINLTPFGFSDEMADFLADMSGRKIKKTVN